MKYQQVNPWPPLVSKMSLSWTLKIRVNCCHSEEPGGSLDSDVSHQCVNGTNTALKRKTFHCIDPVLATPFLVNIWTMSPGQWYVLTFFLIKSVKLKVPNTTLRLKNLYGSTLQDNIRPVRYVVLLLHPSHWDSWYMYSTSKWRRLFTLYGMQSGPVLNRAGPG